MLILEKQIDVYELSVVKPDDGRCKLEAICVSWGRHLALLAISSSQPLDCMRSPSSLDHIQYRGVPKYCAYIPRVPSTRTRTSIAEFWDFHINCYNFMIFLLYILHHKIENIQILIQLIY